MNRILIVDDDKSIQMLFSDELSEEGYEVVTTGDAAEVMALIKEKRPDLVVLDIRLGRDSGLDLLVEIRNTYYNLPVILCTAYSTFQYDLKSIAADYYVVKSSDLGELRDKIKMALEACKQIPSPLCLKGSRSEANEDRNEQGFG